MVKIEEYRAKERSKDGLTCLREAKRPVREQCRHHMRQLVKHAYDDEWMLATQDEVDEKYHGWSTECEHRCHSRQP